MPFYFADWASSLWALCQTAEPHHDTQPHSHLSAQQIERQTKKSQRFIQELFPHTFLFGWVSCCSPCRCMLSLIHSCSSSVAEWSPVRPAYPHWMLCWHNTQGWRKVKGVTVNSVISTLSKCHTSRGFTVYSDFSFTLKRLMKLHGYSAWTKW